MNQNSSSPAAPGVFLALHLLWGVLVLPFVVSGAGLTMVSTPARWAIGLGLLVPVWGLAAARSKWLKSILFLAVSFCFLEILVQLTAVAKILPFEMPGPYPLGAVRTWEEANHFGHNNLRGFFSHRSAFDEGEERRLVVLGDSMVEARQIPKSKHVDALLEGDAALSVQALSLGRGGESFAHVLARLPWVLENLAPTHVVMFVTYGNDFRNLHPGTELAGAQGSDRYVFAALEDEKLTWGEHGAAAAARLESRLPIQPWYQLPSTVLVGNLITPRIVRRVAGRLRRAWTRPAVAPDASAALAAQELRGYRHLYPSGEGRKLATMGTWPAPFARDGAPHDPYWKETEPLAEAILQRIATMTRDAGASLMIVGIPNFTEAFYSQGDSLDWSSVTDDMDLTRPTRWLHRVLDGHAPFIGLDEVYRARGMRPSEIRRLAFMDGRAHLTAEGHEIVASTIRGHLLASGGKFGSDFAWLHRDGARSILEAAGPEGVGEKRLDGKSAGVIAGEVADDDHAAGGHEL